MPGRTGIHVRQAGKGASMQQLEDAPQRLRPAGPRFRERVVRSCVPARLDRLPWSQWHKRMIIALGITWILDGIEVTIIGSLASRLTDKGTIGLTSGQVANLGAVYVAGVCVGAVFFGYLTDRMGRKRLFLITLATYLVGSVACAFAMNFWYFAICRFLTGAGIGGEYSAINSAIDELIPARIRGRVDLGINGSYWVGAFAGTLLAIPLLNESLFNVDLGWRLAFALGAVLAGMILYLRRKLPESPRWLVMHGKEDEAEETVKAIEEEVKESTGSLPPTDAEPIAVQQRDHTPILEILRTMVVEYPRRTILGLTMMTSQAFLYNAIFFTYGLVLTNFYDVDASNVPYFILPFAIGNFLGPLLLGPLFDTVGRRKMIAATYTLSGTLLLITGYLFTQDVLSATTQTLLWCIIFFFASAAASSAHLTVSEIFPLETRGMAIAVFVAVGTAAGGISGPVLFGRLIETASRSNVNIGYIIGAVLMLVAAVVSFILALDAEGKGLEQVAQPLSAVSDTEEDLELLGGVSARAF
jgi:MFS family permease